MRSTFRHAKIEGKLAKLDGMISLVLKELRTTRSSTISSKTAPRTRMAIWSSMRWLPEVLVEMLPVLRFLGPWAWFILTWTAAMIVAAWKGVIPFFGG